MNRTELALAVAEHFHRDQKYGPRPYVYHLKQVAKIVAPWGEDAIVIAYLHDALEDTDIATSTIANIFGSRICDCVQKCTDVGDGPRAVRKERTYKMLSELHGDGRFGLALVVKAADRLANVRHSVKFGNVDKLQMYREEHPFFKKAVLRAMLNAELVDETSVLLGLGL